ncbi:DUF6221 family protein [Nonomuraea dietziae]|uniref:DUF6221 family protein n=1 Tax=Nonomuraea dietziae TaxID=65515 RepID=UPI003436CA2B
MDELIAFLRERLDEDERAAQAGRPAPRGPARELREVEAKRRILEELESFVADAEYLPQDERNADTATAFGIVRLLAMPYDDHDDFREEWKP